MAVVEMLSSAGRRRLMAVRLTCHLVSGEQVEIMSDKEQGLQEAYHAAHSAFDERKIVSGRSPDGGYVLIDAGSVMYVEIHQE
jgi:hypothetical protein